MPSPKPQPTALRLIRGNPGRRPINKNEPKFPAEMPSPPKQLNARALAEWHRLGPEVFRLGLLTSGDRGAFAGYCVQYGRWEEAEENIALHGMTVQAPSGFPMQSPYLAIANKAHELMIKFIAMFGLSPSDRARIVVKQPAAGKKSDWDDLA